MTKKVAEATNNAQATEQDGHSSGSGDADQSNIEHAAENVADLLASVSNAPNEIQSDQVASGSSGKKTKQSKLNSASNFEERIRNLLRAKKEKKESPRSPAMNHVKPYEKFDYVDDEYTDHFYPSQVDTAEVDANITQVDCNM